MPQLFNVAMLLPDANLAAPIWKRKWERLSIVDGQHSRPSRISTFKNDTPSKQTNQLESTY
jgi:hypothetical protein